MPALASLLKFALVYKDCLAASRGPWSPLGVQLSGFFKVTAEDGQRCLTYIFGRLAWTRCGLAKGRDRRPFCHLKEADLPLENASEGDSEFSRATQMLA